MINQLLTKEQVSADYFIILKVRPMLCRTWNFYNIYDLIEHFDHIYELDKSNQVACKPTIEGCLKYGESTIDNKKTIKCILRKDTAEKINDLEDSKEVLIS